VGQRWAEYLFSGWQVLRVFLCLADGEVSESVPDFLGVYPDGPAFFAGASQARRGKERLFGEHRDTTAQDQGSAGRAETVVGRGRRAEAPWF